jgi:hypothetical protein
VADRRLHEVGTITDAAVTDVDVEPTGIGVGFLGSPTTDGRQAQARSSASYRHSTPAGSRSVKFYERSIAYIEGLVDGTSVLRPSTHRHSADNQRSGIACQNRTPVQRDALKMH